MRIIPAIDIKSGKCVRLLKGDFDEVTEYSSDPTEVGQRFSSLAVNDLHIVDLDGARTGRQENCELVAEMAAQSGLMIQLGGGIRSRDDAAAWLNSGVHRCVIGSIAINEPETVKAWIQEFGADAIVLALDIKLNEMAEPMLTTYGWTEDSGISLWTRIDDYKAAGLQHVLCTDVAHDGAMTGPNFTLYAEILSRYPDLNLQASGGVRSITDLEDLRSLGVSGAITGRALLDGEITAAEIASFQQNE
jgi:phosphoribosylformimino-5-aminoimidazole carboxamide ribotide isomerase